MMHDISSFSPSPAELLEVFDIKYRRHEGLGPGPATRLRFGYFNPDDHYEAIVAKLVIRGVAWLDVGCGRDLFPSNRPLAEMLSKRCSHLLGVDPDPNIHENPYVTESFQGMIEDCPETRRFEVVTLRMVAEHIVDPERALSKISRLLAPGGHLVVYTPNRWSPVPLLTAMVPFRFHSPLKRIVWDAESRDTFPTAFKLNTRRALRAACEPNGLSEMHFEYLDDCRTFSAFKWLNVLELGACRALRTVGLRYPENCLLGIYVKQGPT